MRVRFGVIADDFTGANDTGVQFKKHGMETVVLTNVDSIKNIMNTAEVVTIDTESRNDIPDLAYRKVRKVAKTLKTLETKLVYKKIDSTLRGNIGSELDAVMDELGINLTIVAPAYPTNRRITVGGYHFVNWVPLEKTEFAKDPRSPVKESHIPTLIQHQSHRSVGYINLSKVMEGVKSLKKEIYHQKRVGNEIIAVDAVTHNDLKTIAEAVVETDVLPCGSAGLAEKLSAALKNAGIGSVVVISGSVSNVTMQQISRAEEVSNTYLIEPDVQAVLQGRRIKEKEMEKVVKEAIEALKQGKDVIFRSARSKQHVIKAQGIGRKLGMSNKEVGETLLLFLGEVINMVAENSKFDGLVLIGGDTAIRMVKVMKALGTKIEGEVLPGIPACRLIGGKRHGLRIVTKAGGFGSEDAIVDAIEYLKRGD